MFFAIAMVSILIGAWTGACVTKWYGSLVAAAIAWSGFLALLIVTGAPQQDALWMVALVTGGSISAVVAGVSCAIAQGVRRRRE